MVVLAEAWREHLVSRGVLDREADARKAWFWDMKNALKVSNIIAEKDGFVWLCA
jgi:hypothetical protein